MPKQRSTLLTPTAPAALSSNVRPWIELGDRLIQKTLFFDLHARLLSSPRNDYQGDFYYLRIGDWVNVIPITNDRQVVLVEQYRHGIRQPSLELPGGMLDAGEDPKFAALRELAEETGYQSSDAESLGFAHPNPALQVNSNYFFVAHNVSRSSAQTLDQAEDIAVHLVPLSQIPNLIEHHQITHTLVISAFFRYFARYGFPVDE